MTTIDRMQMFNCLFADLSATNSRTEKEMIVHQFERQHPELKEDWTYILETLDNKHPIGWTFEDERVLIPKLPPDTTIKEMIQILESAPDKTLATIHYYQTYFGNYGSFIEPIVNRTLRLGIGKSLLTKADTTPMLAKKYEGGIIVDPVVVTEKLDGNRCVAQYIDGKWCFTSRSGKPMKVNFDMTGLNTDYIYDGEVMSVQQTDLSHSRYMSILQNTDIPKIDLAQSQLLFNTTSGLINRHGSKTGLIYNIFDIISSAPYETRRTLLNEVDVSHTKDVRIVPILYQGKDINTINHLLDKITQSGGEGIMLNKLGRAYANKRTDALLKYKQVQHIDMFVVDIYLGTGKYEGLVGGLTCYIRTDDGKEILCDVGSGLSDEQRYRWAMSPELIRNQIVQIGYHELTQSRDDIGTKKYSLRFPRLIKVRYDKSATSEY